MRVKTTLPFLFFYLLFSFSTTAQSLKYKYYNSFTTYSIQDASGNVFVWCTPNFITDHDYDPSKLWLEETQPGNKATLSKLLQVEVPGYTNVRPYSVVAIGNKIYAVSMVKIDEVTDALYADEIDKSDLGLFGKPFRIFLYNHPRIGMDGTLLQADYGYVHMLQSDDDSKVVFYVNESSPNERSITHTKVFSDNLTNTLWERHDSLWVRNPILSNKGVFVSCFASMPFKNLIDKKDTAAIHARSLFRITTFSENGKKTRTEYQKQYFLVDFKVAFKPDGGIIGCGLFNYEKKESAINYFSEGILYVSYAPDADKPSVEKTNEYKAIWPTVEKHNRFFTREVLIDEEGTAWIITQYAYGVNKILNYGNLLVESIGEDGNVKDAHMIYNEIVSRGLGFASLYPQYPYYAQTVKNSLMIFFCEHSKNDPTKNSYEVSLDKNSTEYNLVSVTIGPDKTLSKKLIESYDGNEPCLAPDQFDAILVSDGSLYIICPYTDEEEMPATIVKLDLQ